MSSAAPTNPVLERLRADCGRGRPRSKDWRGRTFRSLETTLDWLVDFLRPGAVLVVWTDRQKAQARESVYTALERRGFGIETATVRPDGSLVSARRRELSPIRKAA